MNIYEKAVQVYGPESRKDLAIEECSELITKLKHHKRDRVNIFQVAEEVADVKIVMRQLEIVVGVDRVNIMENYKLARLRSKIKDKEKLCSNKKDPHQCPVCRVIWTNGTTFCGYCGEPLEKYEKKKE